jgi:hypothetical protein
MTTVEANGVTIGAERFGDAAAPLVLLADGTTMLSWPGRPARPGLASSSGDLAPTRKQQFRACRRSASVIALSAASDEFSTWAESHAYDPTGDEEHDDYRHHRL